MAIEIAVVEDIFVEDIDHVELLPDGNARIVWYVTQNGERVVVCKQVRSLEACPAGALKRHLEQAKARNPSLAPLH